MAFQEFYANAATGSDVNSGDSQGAPTLSLTNGSWDGTSVYTCAGSPDLSGIVAGRYGALRPDGNSSISLLALVKTVDNVAKTITFSTTAAAGSLTNGSNNRSLIIGGPFLTFANASLNAITSSCTSAESNGNPPRINYKNNATYGITVAVSLTNANGVQIQGYSSTPGDGGKAVVDGGSPGTSFNMVSSNTAHFVLQDFVFQNNGSTGTAAGLAIRGAILRNVRAVNMAGSGFSTSTTPGIFVSCEAHNCNTSNTSGAGGFASSTPGTYYKGCVAHHNTGSAASGFMSSAAAIFDACVAAANGLDGFRFTSANLAVCRHCTAYGNTGSGINITSGSYAVIDGCLLVSNTTAGLANLSITNLISGSGNAFYGNGSATSNVNATMLAGSITCTVNPLRDPANGDFTIATNQVGAVAGSFPLDSASYTKTTPSYRDVGAAGARRLVNAGGLAA